MQYDRCREVDCFSGKRSLLRFTTITKLSTKQDFAQLFFETKYHGHGDKCLVVSLV